MEQFSFTSTKWQSLSKVIFENIPGCKRLHVLTEERNSIAHLSCSSKDLIITDSSPSPEQLPAIQRFRAIDIPHEWLNAEELPWSSGSSKPTAPLQLNLESGEAETGFLVIRLETQRGSGLRDCLILEIDTRMRHYGISRQGEYLNPGNRRIVATLCYNLLITKIKQLSNDRSVFEALKTRIEAERASIDELRQKMIRKQEHYEKSVIGYAESILSSLGAKEGITFLLEESAKHKLAEFDGPFEWLHPAIKSAAESALILTASSGKVVKIHSGDLLLDRAPGSRQVGQQAAPAKDSAGLDRYSSTIDFLDRYESAAKRLENEGKPINGKHIAASCEPPVSPPAISDVLRKHKVKIRHLVDKHPNRWPLLTSSFKPLIRLMVDEESGRQEKTA